jgi:hypothetical protein
MKITKNLGIWMDHSSAHLIEFTANPNETTTVETGFSHDVAHDAETQIHNTEHEYTAYYKKLGEIIKNYDEVLLFGPTDAKAELHNILSADHQFATINIEVKQADKMSENQQHAFVKAHFQNQ